MTTTTISDLSDDLVGEIFSRVPFTCLKAVRSTCKKWNALSKNHIIGKKTASKNQFLEFMITDYRFCSLRFDLQGICKEEEEDFVNPSMKQISIHNNDDQLEITQVYHCDGLLLCIARYNSNPVVWNPYLGQTRWIQAQTRNEFNKSDQYALGYDNNRNHKILRFLYERGRTRGIDVYDFSSDSWRVLDVNLDGDIPFYHSDVSLKGNTYFFGQEETIIKETEDGDLVRDIEDYLICFDFTTERFGPRLHLPLNPPYNTYEYFTLSWVRDEKLAVLYNHEDTYEIYEIWISTKIEPNAVSWSTFLTLDMSLVNGLPAGFPCYIDASSFFIDEEKKVVVLFDNRMIDTCVYQMAYIVGDDGYFKYFNMGKISDPPELVCSSYVPSLVQLQD